MRMLLIAVFFLLMTACALRPMQTASAAASASPVSVATGTKPWQGPDQLTPPLPIARGASQPIVSVSSAHAEAVLPRALIGAKLVASGGRTLYFAPTTNPNSVFAVDTFSGTLRWQYPAFSNGGNAVAASDSLVFVTTVATSTQSSSVLELSARNGSTIFTRPGYWGGGTLHGYFYASHGSQSGLTTFAAYDGASGRALWSVPGAANVGGPPTLIGNTLLQSFSEDGAILVNAMHAFDVATGRELWRYGYGPAPLGSGPGVVYLDTTWFPLQLDNYVPLSIGTVDLATGALLHEYYYKPDRARNWPRGDHASTAAAHAHVGGGFVTFEINGAWYRYESDRDPNNARAVRLDGIDDIASWLDDTHALVIAGDGVAVATWLPDRLDLHPLPFGPLRAEVAISDADTRYAVVGSHLLALDKGGQRVRALGAVGCSQVIDVTALHASVVVRCAPEREGSGEMLMTFRDSSKLVARAFAHPLPTAMPRYTLAVAAKPVPPAGTEPFDRQWWPTSIAAGRDGSLAIVLIPGDNNRPGSIGRVSVDGAVQLVNLPEADEPAHPHNAVIDAHGTIWFNDDRLPTVTSLGRDGALHALSLAGTEVTKAPTPEASAIGVRVHRSRFPKRLRLGLRLAIGPDGEAWYARSHPTAIIGRVDGTRTFAVPSALGEVHALVGGRDGALWFLTTDAVGRIALDGTLTRVPLPEDFTRQVSQQRRLIAGLTNTVWIAFGRKLAEVNSQKILRTWSLPNASSSIADITIGCDGTVYAADAMAAQFVRFGSGASVEEHESGLFSIDGLATASDCRLWFVSGANSSKQQVGTFSFASSK